MKKLLFLAFLVCTVLSCSVEDDNTPNFYNEILPVESVNMPSEFQLGSSHEITMTYLRPTGCHVFSDFYYVSELNQRTVAIITSVFTDIDCETFENEEVQVTLNFQVNNNGTYIFRFWQGEDANGNDIYYIVEVPVVE
ncbi:hypothetical protein AB9K26_11345 [Psychroserpens sp. XS_ASV72]|uniref:hypothetical protein n=1 Tax=Psychroserpens sp. XS_ASV72 TaxID=3241293 RepID=UPI0035126147